MSTLASRCFVKVSRARCPSFVWRGIVLTETSSGLKVLDPEKTAYFESRFKGLDKPTEGEIAMTMEHPKIVKTLKHGMTSNGEQYLIMEFLDGPGLNSLIIGKDERIQGVTLNLMCDMAEAPQAVHDAGYIHRDVCPRNFICNKAVTELKLIDFGLTVPYTPDFCQPGNRTGTPSYMAPEVARRRSTDHRIDIFSLGVTMFQLLTFDMPWPSGDTTGKVALLHDTMAPTEISTLKPDVDPVLDKLIMRCISRVPANRPKDMEEVVRCLHSLK